MIAVLQSLVDREHGTGVSTFLRDAARFVERSDTVIDEYPLQIYASGLVFAPEQSVVRTTFQRCIPQWITQPPLSTQGWDATLRVIETSCNPWLAMRFLPDNRSLQAVSMEGDVLQWDAMTGKQTDSLKPDGGTEICFSSDGKCSLSTDWDGFTMFWGPLTGGSQWRLEDPLERVTSLALSADGYVAACHTSLGLLHLFDYTQGNVPRWSLYVGREDWHGMALSPDGQLLANLSYRKVQLRDLASDEEYPVTLPSSYSGVGLSFSQDSRLIAVNGWDSIVELRDSRTGSLVQKLEGHTGPITALAFAPDGRHVASASQDRTTRLWDLGTGKEAHRFEHRDHVINHLVFSPDGRLLAGTSSFGLATILFWDLTFTGSNDADGPERHSQPIRFLALSRDGKQAASAPVNGSVGIWDLDTGQNLKMLGDFYDRCGLGFLPAHDSIVCSTSEFGTVQCYDTAIGEIAAQYGKPRGGGVQISQLSPDGKLFSVNDAFRGAT